LDIERESHGDIGSKSQHLLKDLLTDFAKVEDARRYEIEKSWQDFIPKDEADKADLIARLSHERSAATAKKVADLINDSHNVEANNLTLALLNKPFDQCNDGDIGQCQGQLRMLVDYHPPIPPPTPPLVPPAVNEPAPVIKILTSENLINALRAQITAAELPRAIVQQALQQLLNDYKDA
jgi:hypothetical protein